MCYLCLCRSRANSNTNKAPPRNVGSSSPRGICLDVTMNESLHDIQSHLSGNPPNQFSNVGSNNINMGSTTNTAFAKSLVIKKSAILTSVKHLYPSSAFHSLKGSLIYAPHQVVLDNGNDVAAPAVLAQPRGTPVELQNKHLYHHKNHHHLERNVQQQLPLDHNDLSMKKMAAAAPHCGSSNVFGGPPEGNTANYNVDGNSSSNGQNGSSLAVNAEGKDLESDNGTSGNSGRGDASGSGRGNRVGHKFSQREAALTKIRHKRKERCYQEKVTDVHLFH